MHFVKEIIGTPFGLRSTRPLNLRATQRLPNSVPWRCSPRVTIAERLHKLRAALAFGPPADWRTVMDYYDGAEPSYTTQLRSLEKYVRDNPSAPEGHFLLGYHYLMTGYEQAAMKHFDEVEKIAPNDKFTSELVQKLAGEPRENEVAATATTVGGWWS